MRACSRRSRSRNRRPWVFLLTRIIIQRVLAALLDMRGPSSTCTRSRTTRVCLHWLRAPGGQRTKIIRAPGGTSRRSKSRVGARHSAASDIQRRERRRILQGSSLCIQRAEVVRAALSAGRPRLDRARLAFEN